MVFIFFSSLFYIHVSLEKASLVAQLVKNLPAMWETWVRSLGWEDPVEKGKATHSSILAWRIVHMVAKSQTTERLSLSLERKFTFKKQL